MATIGFLEHHTLHKPYPAMIVNRAGELLAANEACDVFFEGVAPDLLEPPLNTRRVALHPAGMAPRVLNYEQWARTWTTRAICRSGLR